MATRSQRMDCTTRFFLSAFIPSHLNHPRDHIPVLFLSSFAVMVISFHYFLFLSLSCLFKLLHVALFICFVPPHLTLPLLSCVFFYLFHFLPSVSFYHHNHHHFPWASGPNMTVSSSPCRKWPAIILRNSLQSSVFLSLSCIFFVASILFPRNATASFLLSRYKQRWQMATERISQDYWEPLKLFPEAPYLPSSCNPLPQMSFSHKFHCTLFIVHCCYMFRPLNVAVFKKLNASYMYRAYFETSHM